jgi:DNA-binding PadR family transcriptional regulator
MGRAHRRVLLVLLTGASRLSGYPISRAGMVGSGHVYVVLARLEREGWVESEWEAGEALPNGGRRRFYHLTPYGRTRALKVLGLED